MQPFSSEETLQRNICSDYNKTMAYYCSSHKSYKSYVCPNHSMRYSSGAMQYPERASALDFEDAATPKFGHGDVNLNLFTETRFYALNCLLYPIFSKHFSFLGVTRPNNLTSCQKYHKFRLLSISADD